MELKGLEKIPAKRFIRKYSAMTPESFEEKFESISLDDPEQKEFPQSAIDKMHERFMQTPSAKAYMKGRGFERATMEHFKVGFTPASSGPIYRPQDMVVVPAYDYKGKPVGLVGRSIEGKMFKNYGPEAGGRGFHKSHHVWNLQNAKSHSRLVIVESTFDGMRVHQAGYPNVGALLGGSLSKTQKQLISRHFEGVIIMTDNETVANNSLTYHKHCVKCLRKGHDMCQGHAPGRDLGLQIAAELPRLDVRWAFYDDKNVYANGVKDASDMTDDEIRQCLRNSISHYDYYDLMVA